VNANATTRVLELRDIHRSFTRRRKVLTGISFDLVQGEVVGLLDRNGAGKSTLLYITMGMLFPDRGSVRVFGGRLRDDPVAIKQRIGFVSENQILPEHLHVDEVIAFHRSIYPSWDDALEAEIAARFDIPRGAHIKTLSKGEARQVALLCAAAHRPKLLILDEPAGGLDVTARRAFLETAVQLLNESGTTILFASHHIHDVERMASRVVLIEGGQVLLDSALDHVQEQCCLAVVPEMAGIDPESLDACLRVRRDNGSLRVVLQVAPDQGEVLLREQLGIESPHCVSLPLEDLFVELTGRSS
jgi:ABC-2 type transport system ATP-binding protein